MRRRVLFAVVAVCLAVVVALGLAEVALRIVYRDAGTHTSGGPGGGPFAYTYNGGTLRAPEVHDGPRRAGISRIVIQGDSVTWGQGVEKWYDLYPERLLERLNADGERYEMAVYAAPGREVTSHVRGLQTYPGTLDPDIIVYQWYVNDFEIDKSERPDSVSAPWHHWPGHLWAWTHSYLYFFLDDRLRLVIPGGARSYPEYMDSMYAVGTHDWDLFVGQFKEWARLAKLRHPKRIIVMLYPTLLANGGDPMPEMRAQMADIAHLLDLEVLDLTPALQGFNTHASLFDAHPNAMAHSVMADRLYDLIMHGPDGPVGN